MNFEEKILETDNQPAILDYRFEDGSSLWLTARFMLRLKQLSVASGTAQKSVNNAGGKSVLLGYLWHCLIRGPWRSSGKKDIISIANYEGNPLLPNRMTIFLKQLPEFKRAEWLYSPSFLKFKGIKDTFSFDYFYFRALIHKKFKGRKNQAIRIAEIEKFIQYLEAEFAEYFTSNYFNELKYNLISIDGLTVKYRSLIHKYLSKTHPKIIICSEGNNGDWRHGIVFSETKKLGIKTGEVQHGAFNLGMKYGDQLVKQETFKQQKSDYLFTFGNFHASQTNISSVCIPLGHFHMEMKLSEINKEKPKKEGLLNILFICEGEPPSSIDNGLILNTLPALRALKKPFELVVRLHPSEGPSEKYNELMALDNARYSTHKEDSIYQLIYEADIVISHASTVVFESLYFEKTPLIYWDRATEIYIPKGIGKGFSTSDELLELINDEMLTSKTLPVGDYWQQGGVVNNFKSFLKQYSILEA